MTLTALDGWEGIRRRNWLALAVGVLVMAFSYFPYSAAFIVADGDEGTLVDPGLLAIGLVVAPFVFVAVGWVSGNPATPRSVLISMGLLVALGLSLGLLGPPLGAAAGFGTGVAICLRSPGFPNHLRRRLLGVTFAVAYTLLLLLLLPPAGVLGGAVLPVLMVGFADEYGAWMIRRAGS